MPHVVRTEPGHLQIAAHYRREISEGRLRPGDRLPTVRALRDQWQTGQNTAQRAVECLRTAGLVVTRQDGTYVAPPRNAVGPQQRLRLATAPDEDTTVTSAEMADPPAYVLPVLGLAAGARAVRREQVTRQDGRPRMLTVTWSPPWAATLVPELLDAAPLPDPRGAGTATAAAMNSEVEPGRTSVESRPASDREAAALELGPGTCVLAGTWYWLCGGNVVEYGEFILPPGQVMAFDIEP